MPVVRPVWDYANLERVDAMTQEALSVLRGLDPSLATEWANRIEGIWEKYADIVARLEEHERYDPAGLQLLAELDREVGKPLLEDVRVGLLQDVAVKVTEGKGEDSDAR